MSNKDLASLLTPLVINHWSKANSKLAVSPVKITERSIERKILNLLDKASDIVWGRENQKFKEKFENDLDILMDITTCPHQIYTCQEPMSGCTDNENCKLKVHIICTCPYSSKIPAIELFWFYHQRSKIGEKSKMQMVGCDHKETKKQNKARKRKFAEAEAEENRQKKQEAVVRDFLDREKEFEKECAEDDIKEKEFVEEACVMEDYEETGGKEFSESLEDVVDSLLLDRLGEYSYLVKRYLKPKVKNNFMKFQILQLLVLEMMFQMLRLLPLLLGF